MQKIVLPSIKEEQISENSSKFTIEPLYPGYGPTLGNSLRRVLLSSLPGAAISSFKIDGVSHEFTTIPHVKEDAIEIMLNLKGIKIKSFSEEPVTLSINKKGPGEVLAGDFSKNDKVEILNPDFHIATLDAKAKFELEAEVEYDRGFRSTEDLEETSSELGKINVDTAYSPIERVKMEVENTRVGRMTNYDKLILEVSTNGSIKAADAVIEASNILIDHFKEISFKNETPNKLTEKVAPEEPETEEIIGEEIEMPTDGKSKVEDLGFSSRTTNALINAGIKTLAGLKRLSDLKLSEIKGLGDKGIVEIKEKLG